MVRNCRFDGPADGESALKESTDVIVEDSYFNLRYPFWHVHGLTIKNSEMTDKCRASMWYSENLTLINCTIKGTQPLCYCKGLKLVGCEMIDCDLAFERSEVEAEITSPVISIKNPLSGCITVPDVGEIIRDIPGADGEVVIQN